MTLQKRPKSIDDALKILDDALAKQSLPEIRPLLDDEFDYVKSTLGEKATSSFNDLSKTAVEIGGVISSLGSAGFDQASELANVGFEQAKKLGTEIDQRVRENPWPLIGGIALGGFAFGVMLARHINTPEEPVRSDLQ